MPYDTVEVPDLNPILHLTGTQEAWQIGPFVSVSHARVVFQTIVFLCLLPGSLQ